MQAAIDGLGGDGAGLTPVLLPDLLTFDTTDPSTFLNGRALADDVIDFELNLLTGGEITTDGVNANDVPSSTSSHSWLPQMSPPSQNQALLDSCWSADLVSCGVVVDGIVRL